MPRRPASLVFLFFALAFTLTNAFRETVQLPDEEYVLQVTDNLVSGKPLHLRDDIPRYAGATYTGADGKTYSVYQIGQSLVYAPFYWLAKNLLAYSEPYHPERHGDRRAYGTWLERQTRRYLSLCPVLFAALSCTLLFLFAGRLGYSEPSAFLMTLAYGFGTMVWPYSKFLLTEGMQNALLLASVYLLFHQRREEFRVERMLAAGALFGILLSIRASFLILVPVLGVYWFWRNHDRGRIWAAVLFFAAMVLFAVPQLVYDHVRFRNVLATGYSTAGFVTPLWVGLYGYLFSSGKSFFLYTPAAILALFGLRRFWARAPREAALFGAIAVLVPLKYASWWVWSGDPAWGPRYLLVLTPYFLLVAGEIFEWAIAAGRTGHKVLLGGVLAISFVVQIPAVATHYLHYYQYVRRYAARVPLSQLSVSPAARAGVLPTRDPYVDTEFNPEYSPLLGQWWVVKALVLGEKYPGKSAPWKGLGYTELHAAAPLNAKWDVWLVELILHGLKIRNIRVILGAVALLIFFTIVAEEAFRTLFFRKSRPPDE